MDLIVIAPLIVAVDVNLIVIAPVIVAALVSGNDSVDVIDHAWTREDRLAASASARCVRFCA